MRKIKKAKILALAGTIPAIAGSAIAATIGLSGCAGTKEDIIVVPEIDESGTVVILATGGTIAGAGEAGKETGYTPGAISVESLIASVPGIEEIAPLYAEQVCNVNSDDITSKTWVHLAKVINAYAKDEKIAGFVVLHGTDTMEETAYFLNLAVNTTKPVVITGSMRPATSISADGPMNLYQSVVVASSPEAANKGVLGVFSDSIYSARSMQKTSTFDVTAISAGPMGAMGYVRNKDVYMYEQSCKKHTDASEFANEEFLGAITSLPNAEIVYFEADADPRIIDWAFQTASASGLVVAGAGAGEFSEKYISKLESYADAHPIIISSRIDNGVIVQDSILVKKAVAANDLPPHKAVVLLRLALAKAAYEGRSLTQAELIELFKSY